MKNYIINLAKLTYLFWNLQLDKNLAHTTIVVKKEFLNF